MIKMQKDDIEKMIILISIGLAFSLKNNTISYDDAAKILFSPRMMEFAKNQSLDMALVDLIHEATELEDVADLLPNKIDSELSSFLNDALCLLEKKPFLVNRLTVWDKICVISNEIKRL